MDKCQVNAVAAAIIVNSGQIEPSAVMPALRSGHPRLFRRGAGLDGLFTGLGGYGFRLSRQGRSAGMTAVQ